MNNNVGDAIDKPLGGGTSHFIRKLSKRLSRRRKKKAAVAENANHDVNKREGDGGKFSFWT